MSNWEQNEKKTRNKSWRRPRNILLVFLIVIIPWVAYEIRWQMTKVPAPVVDYAARINDLVASHQPEGENGWESLIQAMAKIEAIEAEIVALELGEPNSLLEFDIDYHRLDFNPLDLVTAPRETRVLKQLKEYGVFDRLQSALDQPRHAFLYLSNTSLITNFFPEVGKFRHFIRLRAATLRIALADHDIQGFLQGIDQIFTLNVISSHQPTLIARLITIANNALAFRSLQMILMEHELDEATCLAVLESMDRLAAGPGWELIFEGERNIVLEVFQSSFTDDGHGDGRLDIQKFGTFSGKGVGVFENVAAVFLAGRKESTDLVNEYFDNMIVESTLNRVERDTSPFDSNTFLDHLTNRQRIVPFMMSPFDVSLELWDFNKMSERGTRIMLHLEIHKHRHGDYPESLDELDVQDDPDVLLDPLNGKHFGYRRIDPDASGRTYVLYSLNFDGQDDHVDTPLVDLENDFPRTKQRETGTDILINRRRKTRAEAFYDIDP